MCEQTAFGKEYMIRYTHLLAIGLIALSGCSTYKNYAPSVNEPSRDGLSLRQPVIVSVFDGRGNREGGQDPAQNIKTGLQKAYPEGSQLPQRANRRCHQPATGRRRLEPEPLDEPGSFAPCIGTPHIPEKMAGCPMPPPCVRGFSGPAKQCEEKCCDLKKRP